jgi:hypothetical protein
MIQINLFVFDGSPEPFDESIFKAHPRLIPNSWAKLTASKCGVVHMVPVNDFHQSKVLRTVALRSKVEGGSGKPGFLHIVGTPTDFHLPGQSCCGKVSTEPGRFFSTSRSQRLRGENHICCGPFYNKS